MAANYLHGVETVEIPNGVRKISIVKSAVIAIVGIAPKGPAESLVQVLNEVDASQFGLKVPGFNIPSALDSIFKQGAGTVLVVNVFDETINCVSVTAESKTTDTKGKTKTAYAPIGSTMTVTHTSGTPTYVRNTDYKIDDFGNFVTLNFTSIPPSSVIKITYKKLDASTVTKLQLEGAITLGVRTGSKLFEEAYNTFGYKGKIFISPNYASTNSMALVLSDLADKYKGICLLDAPEGTTVSGAISGRGVLGSINFNTSSERVVLCYPMVKATSADTGLAENKPYSQFMAGVIASTDNEFGYWYSPSNKEIGGILGLELPISGSINDSSTDANALNEVGITTVLTSFGTGNRTWGNRNASFPTNTSSTSFVSVRRTADIVHESIEFAMLPFIDEPLNQALIDVIRDSVNAFFRTLIGRGAVAEGSNCTFSSAKNPPEELAAGHITFDLNFSPFSPTERITFESFIDISLLKSLV